MLKQIIIINSNNSVITAQKRIINWSRNTGTKIKQKKALSREHLDVVRVFAHSPGRWEWAQHINRLFKTFISV